MPLGRCHRVRSGPPPGACLHRVPTWDPGCSGLSVCERVCMSVRVCARVRVYECAMSVQVCVVCGSVGGCVCTRVFE